MLSMWISVGSIFIVQVSKFFLVNQSFNKVNHFYNITYNFFLFHVIDYLTLVLLSNEVNGYDNIGIFFFYNRHRTFHVAYHS